MAGIALGDRDRKQQPRVADFMRPRRRDAGHAGLLDVLAQQRRAHDRTIAADLVRRALRRAAEQDRVVAMVDRLDVDDRLRPQVAGIVAGPLAERTLDALVAGLDETLKHDFRVGRNRQAGDRAPDHLHRLAAHAADDLVFAHAVGHFAAGHQEGHRVAAADHRDRHRLIARAVFVAHLPAVLAGRDVEARGLGVVDHHPVGAAIDPALVRFADDVEAAGADIAAAVRLMPLRCRKFGHVHVIAFEHVLEDRTLVDVFRLNAPQRSHELGAETFAQLDLGQLGREAERHVLALAAKKIDQHAAAFDGAGHLVEHETGGVVVLQRHGRDHADVLLPRQAADLLDLAEPARRVEPLAQIVIAQACRRVGAIRGLRAPPDRGCHRIGLIVLFRHWLSNSLNDRQIRRSCGCVRRAGSHFTFGRTRHRLYASPGDASSPLLERSSSR